MEKPPKPSTPEQTLSLAEQYEALLQLPTIEGVEPPLSPSSESYRTPAEYRASVEQLKGREVFSDDIPVQRFFEWLERGVDYLEYPFRYKDVFGTSSEGHTKRKEWEFKELPKSLGEVYERTQITKNNSFTHLTGMLHLAPPEFREQLQDLAGKVAEIEESYREDWSSPAEGSGSDIGTLEREAPYLGMYLEEKQEVVQRIVDVTYELIDRAITFYESKLDLKQ